MLLSFPPLPVPCLFSDTSSHNPRSVGIFSLRPWHCMHKRKGILCEASAREHACMFSFHCEMRLLYGNVTGSEGIEWWRRNLSWPWVFQCFQPFFVSGFFSGVETKPNNRIWSLPRPIWIPMTSHNCNSQEMPFQENKRILFHPIPFTTPGYDAFNTTFWS